ncbi:MAG TPA: hypothetical protein PLX84_06800 [Acidiphilium sp.]|nr:hypothetical protein [Acidiphilium sp.]
MDRNQYIYHPKWKKVSVLMMLRCKTARPMPENQFFTPEFTNFCVFSAAWSVNS